MTENDLQRAVAKLLDYSGLTWFHPPMEGFRTPRSGGHMKAKGSKAGVPDCIITTPPRMGNPYPGPIGYHNGLALELKVGKNKQTPAQLEWADKLRACGWRVEVCRSIDEVMAVMKECYPDRYGEK